IDLAADGEARLKVGGEPFARLTFHEDLSFTMRELAANRLAYLAHAGRKAETARELHLNRQTLYNRLARIAELLGTDLDDPHTVLALSLALRARRHVG
ncbi:helix-turn-helix domain-containing protein, partial [Streptomyces albidoflavus]|uniref:helix-turn-helix domain-containing protein n=1 Tax=Streptomyces albidoflavus TaxID=1886 RepID=UPI00211BEBF0